MTQIIDEKLLIELSNQAKHLPRLRSNLDLRNSAEDKSQRMLNALEPGTIYPSIGIKKPARLASAFVVILRNISMMRGDD